MISAVAYVRMSSDRQEASPKQQREEIEKLAKRGGYRIAKWYIDEAVSGDATEKRLQFNNNNTNWYNNQLVKQHPFKVTQLPAKYKFSRLNPFF